MAGDTKLDAPYADYLRSGCWICPGWLGKPSPTGAHHWIHVSGRTWVCKHCWDSREFPLTFYDAVEVKVIQLPDMHWIQNRVYRKGEQ